MSIAFMFPVCTAKQFFYEKKYILFIKGSNILQKNVFVFVCVKKKFISIEGKTTYQQMHF